MELGEPIASTSGVFVRMHSRRGSAAALLVLALQLLFTGLVPVADARAAEADTGSWLGVHVEKPGVHHPVHDSGDCVFCVALQLGAAPAHFGRVPDAAACRRVAAPVERPRPCASVHVASQVARAPPFAA